MHISEKRLREYIRDLIKSRLKEIQELEEASTTISVGGSYDTPHAFGSKKNRHKSGYKGGHTHPDTGDYTIVKDPKLRKRTFNQLESVQLNEVDFDAKLMKKYVSQDPFLKKSLTKMPVKGNEALERLFRAYIVGDPVEIRDYLGESKLNEAKITIFDNGGKTADRYIVIIDHDVFGMSNNPLSPQGVNQYYGTVGSDVKIGSHLGKKLSKIPDAIKKAVKQRLSESILLEGHYHNFRNNDQYTNKQKIGHSMKEVRDTLTELEKLVKINVRFKNETHTESTDYWNRTHNAISKITERLGRLSKMVEELGPVTPVKRKVKSPAVKSKRYADIKKVKQKNNG